jgi:TonB-linked SusC/RagA family outer membrane protein
MRIIGLSLAFVMALCAAKADAQDPGAPPTPAPIAPLDRTVTLEVQNSPLVRVIESINEQAGLGLAYSDQILPKEKLVTLTVRNITARQALAAVLEGTGIVLRVSSAGVLILTREAEGRRTEVTAESTAGIVSGAVTDSASGEPVPNVIVSVKGTTVRASTSDRGQYLLRDVPVGAQVVMTRLLGYLPLEKEVIVTNERRARADFALRHGLTRLQEVVTTATGRQRRLELGNDITVINADSVVRAMPIANMTELLEGRVPGLTVQRTSGAPGDPARIRLRGAGSALLSNDPIIVVDGIRVYSEQSNARGANLAGGGYAAPSPLDYIDPNSIETIEVIKGPSAATLYGQDAANGVIVVTTKKGRLGPPSWNMSLDRGTTRMAGQYPELLFRWGHRLTDGAPVLCPIRNRLTVPVSTQQGAACAADSLTRFQLLSDPALTVLDKGNRSAFTLGVSGGSSALRYTLTGSHRDEMGLIRLPEFEVERYRGAEGVSPPAWMTRPQRLKQWGATSSIGAEIGRKAEVTLTSQLSRLEQNRSALENRLADMMGTYLDQASGTYWQSTSTGTARPGAQIGPVDNVLTNYYERATAATTAFTNGANLLWRPMAWLTANADAGLNVIQRADETFLPRGLSSAADSVGRLRLGQGTSLVSTLNMRANARAPLGRGFQLQFATGVNYTAKAITDMTGTAENLPAGTGSPGQTSITSFLENREDQATFGWYVEPTISHKLVWLSTGMRLDGGSTFGTRVKLPTFPKLSLSYLVSDGPLFPGGLKSVFNMLRLRAAYGHAGVQPGPAVRLRLYGAPEPIFVDGRLVDAVKLDKLGNTQLVPERSKEMEAGFDADLLNNRLSVVFTGYTKTTTDAIMNVPLPPSVYIGTVPRNVGVIRNSGFDLTVITQPVRTDALTWGLTAFVTQSRNEVVELGRGVQPFYANGISGVRVAAGYPLFGRWARPILGFSDANGDGVLQPSEVLLGDTNVYMGQTLPNYMATLATTASFFRGALAVTAGLTYEDGLAQHNDAAARLLPFSSALNDENASFAEQAAAARMEDTPFGLIQTVSTLRFNELAVTYNARSGLAQRFGARALSLSLQGRNLGLRTNYAGLDPNVNGRVSGNDVLDTGLIPQPRTWQLRVNAIY